jgi:hypothetical protein
VNVSDKLGCVPIEFGKKITSRIKTKITITIGTPCPTVRRSLQTPPRVGPQVELTGDGIAELRREIVAGSIPSKKSWWGYDVIQIDDPDGNELLFPVSDH